MKDGRERVQHFRFPDFDPSLDQYRKRGAEFNADVLRRVLDFSAPDEFQHYLQVLEKELALDKRQYIDAPRERLREMHIPQMTALMKSISVTADDDEANPAKGTAFIKALVAFDLALYTRLTVHTCLYYDTIRELGTQKHVIYAERAYQIKDYGCFALTELGHGSNANGIQTIANYDHSSRSFVLHTPNPLAAKFWIGAAGKTANMAVVYAHLLMGETNHGLHSFLVPIRDYDTHDPISGVVLGDCGPKAGLDGIDNGYIIFTHYRVPYDALLDRFSQITLDGKFKSTIKSKTKRFATMLSGLLRGRSGVFLTSAAQLRNALTIAVRYGAVRKQFSLSEGAEVPILDYQIHRYRLMPHLANFFAVQMGTDQFIVDYKPLRTTFRADPEHGLKEEIHAVASAQKVLSSIYGMAGLQECREACGGLGYSAFSMLGMMREGLDVTTTWEGANHILIQQTAKFILKSVQKLVKGQKLTAESMQWLTLDREAVNRARMPNSPLRGNPDLLLTLAAHKLNRLVHNSMLHLQENVGKCRDMMDAWNHSQVHHLFDASLAFGELYYLRLLLRQTEAARVKCAKTGELLQRITELYLFTKVEKDLAVFREYDYMSAETARAVKAYVVELCEELGESSVRIIDAIALPDRVVGSVLGMRDGQVYRHFTEAVEGAKDVYAKAPWFPLLRELRGPNSKL